jgi:hypothetical protein
VMGIAALHPSYEGTLDAIFGQVSLGKSTFGCPPVSCSHVESRRPLPASFVVRMADPSPRPSPAWSRISSAA